MQMDRRNGSFRTVFLLALLLARPAAAVDFPQGLVLHYGFDDYQGVRSPVDLSGRGNNGRGVGTAWTAAGKKGGAVECSATNGVITVTNAPSLPTTALTVAVWFKVDRQDALARTMVEKHPERGFALGITEGKQGSRLRFRVGDRECLGDGAVADAAWHHAVATCNGRQLKLYVDGQLQKQVTELADGLPVNERDLMIGRHRVKPGEAEPRTSFAGALDELMLFNQAISAEQVQAVLAAARPKFSEAEVRRRLNELKELYDRGLLTQEFYDRKVAECQPAE